MPMAPSFVAQHEPEFPAARCHKRSGLVVDLTQPVKLGGKSGKSPNLTCGAAEIGTLVASHAFRTGWVRAANDVDEHKADTRRNRDVR